MRKLIAVSIFFSKSFFFSYVNNLSLPLIFISATVLFIAGGLGKHEIVILMLIVGISNRLMLSVKTCSENSSSLSEQLVILPLTQIQTAAGYIWAGVLYSSFLLCLCVIAGLFVETPVVFESIVPTRVNSQKTSLGEPIIFVEGVTLNPEIFLVRTPLFPSLLFDTISGEPFYIRSDNPDSLLKRFGGKDELFKENIIFKPIRRIAPGYYSSVLQKLKDKHLRVLITIASIIFMCFLIDAMQRYQEKGPQSLKRLFIQTTEFLFFIMYIVLAMCLICDILLPDSCLWKVHSIIFSFKEIWFFIWINIMTIGVIRTLMFFTSQKPNNYAKK